MKDDEIFTPQHKHIMLIKTYVSNNPKRRIFFYENKNLATLTSLCLTVSVSLAQQENRIFADGAQLEVVSREGIGFNEGVVAAKDGKIYTLGVTWLKESI